MREQSVSEISTAFVTFVQFCKTDTILAKTAYNFGVKIQLSLSWDQEVKKRGRDIGRFINRESK